MTIHYMIGVEKPQSKTGCGIHSNQGAENFDFVFWKDRDKVTCPMCLEKVKKMNNLQHSGLLMREAVDEMLKVTPVDRRQAIVDRRRPKLSGNHNDFLKLISGQGDEEK